MSWCLDLYHIKCKTSKCKLHQPAVYNRDHSENITGGGEGFLVLLEKSG